MLYSVEYVVTKPRNQRHAIVAQRTEKPHGKRENAMSKLTLFDTIRSLTGHGSRLSVERIYCEAMGKDLAGGMFLSQLIFWSDKGKRADGYVYRTALEWENDTYLSTYLVRKYTKQCEDFGWPLSTGQPTPGATVDAARWAGCGRR